MISRFVSYFDKNCFYDDINKYLNVLLNNDVKILSAEQIDSFIDFMYTCDVLCALLMNKKNQTVDYFRGFNDQIFSNIYFNGTWINDPYLYVSKIFLLNNENAVSNAIDLINENNFKYFFKEEYDLSETDKLRNRFDNDEILSWLDFEQCLKLNGIITPNIDYFNYQFNYQYHKNKIDFYKQLSCMSKLLSQYYNCFAKMCVGRMGEFYIDVMNEYIDDPYKEEQIEFFSEYWYLNATMIYKHLYYAKDPIASRIDCDILKNLDSEEKRISYLLQLANNQDENDLYNKTDKIKKILIQRFNYDKAGLYIKM